MTSQVINEKDEILHSQKIVQNSGFGNFLFIINLFTLLLLFICC